MIVDLYDLIRQFPPCAKNRLQERRRTASMTLFPPREPLTEVGIDILVPLLNTGAATGMFSSSPTAFRR